MYSINNFLSNNDCLIDLDNSIIICHLEIIPFDAVAGFDKIMINDVIVSAARDSHLCYFISLPCYLRCCFY